MSQFVHIITGGGTGIGAASAKRLARRGEQVLIIGRRQAALGQAASEAPGHIHTLALDIAADDAPRAVRHWLAEACLRPRSIVHNAAILDPVARLGDIDDQAWRHHLDINLTAPLRLTQGLLEQLCPGGRQLFISSGAAHSPIAGWAAYCASKAALHMLMQQFAKEFDAETLASADLRPGVVDTPMQAAIRASRSEDFPAVARFRDLKDNGKLVSPEEVAGMVMGLLLWHDHADFHGKSWDMRNPEHLSRWTEND
jgi:NAD(P)-dependent dehydrogenase (short-subunit alcohol dehydrogenase family)